VKKIPDNAAAVFLAIEMYRGNALTDAQAGRICAQAMHGDWHTETRQYRSYWTRRAVRLLRKLSSLCPIYDTGEGAERIWLWLGQEPERFKDRWRIP